jgi:hypothetical protein
MSTILKKIENVVVWLAEKCLPKFVISYIGFVLFWIGTGLLMVPLIVALLLLVGQGHGLIMIGGAIKFVTGLFAHLGTLF